jgi:HSP20 family protein
MLVALRFFWQPSARLRLMPTGGSMFEKKQSTLVPTRGTRDPFALLRQMTSELDRAFEDWPSFRWPSLSQFATSESAAWSPKIDVFERDNRLVTRVDLPGMKKEDVSVEVTDGHLALCGERKHEKEEKKDNVYRSERDYGSFYRAVPLPDGVKLEDVKATFADGVLEVSVPLPAKPEATVKTVQIEEPKTAAKGAA